MMRKSPLERIEPSCAGQAREAFQAANATGTNSGISPSGAEASDPELSASSMAEAIAGAAGAAGAARARAAKTSGGGALKAGRSAATAAGAAALAGGSAAGTGGGRVGIGGMLSMAEAIDGIALAGGASLARGAAEAAPAELLAASRRARRASNARWDSCSCSTTDSSESEPELSYHQLLAGVHQPHEDQDLCW